MTRKEFAASEPTTPPDDLITLAEAAVLASKSTATVDRWRRGGRLATWRRGSRVYVSRRELLDLVAPRRVPTPPGMVPKNFERCEAMISKAWGKRCKLRTCALVEGKRLCAHHYELVTGQRLTRPRYA